MKKAGFSILFLLLAVMLFAGGARQDASKGDTASLRFFWWGSDERHQASIKAIELYEQRNPGVKIAGEYAGWDSYYEKLVTQLAGGTAADIIQIDQTWIYELSSRDSVFKVLDGNPLVNLSGFDRTFLNDTCTFNGQLIGLPTGLNGETWLVDTDFLTRSGVDPNVAWTWDSVITEGRKVNAANPSDYLIGFEPYQMRLIFVKYIVQKTGQFIDDNKNVMFTEKDAEDAFAYFKQWIDLKIIPPFSDSMLYNRKMNENPDWINGHMGITHTWASSLPQAKAGRNAMVPIQIPVMNNAKDSSILVRASQVLAVNNHSEYADEAIKFLNFMFYDPQGIEALGTCRGIPPTVAARELLVQKQMIDPQMQLITDNALAKMGKPFTAWQQNSEILQIVEDVIEQFGYGRLNPAQAAKQMRDNIIAKLATL